MYANQKTISDQISFEGIGLHSGNPVKINLIPEDINHGLIFNLNNQSIKASWKNALVSQLCTKIKNESFYVSTIEHLMSALSGLGVTNLTIKTDSNEMPILDGSSYEYVNKMLEVGIIDQNIKQKFLKIKEKVSYKLDEKYIEIAPYDQGLIIDYTIDYKDDFIKKQTLSYEHNFEEYKKIYMARTFCLHKDLEKIFSMGLAKGGSLDNAIVVSGNKILNQGGLRYPNEFVKHKVLDCVGDLYLAEHHILGHVTTYGGGHELNLMLLKEIFKNKKNYELIEINSKSKVLSDQDESKLKIASL